ncbi:heavy metal translocating P-type ATPase [Terrarubrum flagellatum]|uniref:heavy metal translocating P-type ATPase n=1 Tax=Terrirubrum flagellatum TaxID=2895980 RepID=UPI003144EC39
MAAAGGSTLWKVTGMDCGSCATTIRTALERMPGVSDIRISITNETVALLLDDKKTSGADIEKQISRLGYTPSLIDAQAKNAGAIAHEAPRAWWRQPKGQLAIASGALVALAYGASLVIPAWSYALFIAATIIAAAPIARRAISAAFARAPFTIQMLLTIAVIGALAIGAAEEAAVVVFLFCVGEVLEGVAANQAREGIRSLAALVPQSAFVEQNGRVVEVAAASLAVGQMVLVRPGDRAPADGKVVEGHSSMDESPITGESAPRTKGPGADVFAGSINHEAALKLRVERAAKDNMISRIVALVEEAQESKAPTERFIDRFSRIYMPFIVGLSALVAIIPPLAMGASWSEWVYRGLTLLLIGCPCALVISVPAAIASSLSTAARHGLLIKGGAIVESLARTEIVAFDKTGTLTEGRPVVTEAVAFVGSEADLLARAAAIEGRSSHPLAEAITKHAAKLNIPSLPAAAVKAIPGKGMEGEVGAETIFIGAPRHAAERVALASDVGSEIARLENEGKTVVVVAKGAAVAGLIALRDEPRRDAAAAIAELKAMGVDAVMLTGDNAQTGAAIGRALGISAKAEMLPADKADAIKALAASKRVAMIGDGINDAPALASAHVGVAMGSGTGVALETADAALLKNRVADVPALIKLSRATMANIRENITIALALKALFVVTTITGTTGLWMAVIADTGGTVLVTLNALRLLGWFRSQKSETPTAGDNRNEPALATS